VRTHMHAAELGMGQTDVSLLEIGRELTTDYSLDNAFDSSQRS